MKRQRRKYQTPQRPWDRERLETESVLIERYGLKNKRELWKAQALLRKYRRLARALIARHDAQKEKTLIDKLVQLNLLKAGANLDGVLTLTVEDFLGRRLQTVVFNKNFANTPHQARQFITHGHVTIEDRKVLYPSYIVASDEEDKIVVRATPVKKSNSGEGIGSAATN